jgi:hypothetical protein
MCYSPHRDVKGGAMKDKLIYAIQCRTGCTCCAYENHIRGLYLTKEEAVARMDRFRRGVDNPLSSQYARFGSYSLEECSVEEISGDRVIVGGQKVFSKSSIVKVNLDDGSIEGDDYLEALGY